jgi:ATP-dependent DNA helicase RecQ
MEFLTRALDDPTAVVCGHCANDLGRGFPTVVGQDLVRDAVRFLRGESRPIAPRLLWPADAGSEPSGRIHFPNEPGFALCGYGDAGWGRAVAEGKYVVGEFSDELVEAAVNLLRSSLAGATRPQWVTAMPSASRPNLVASLAQRIARGLGIPFLDVLTVRHGARPQKEMDNSSQQFTNAHHKLDVLADRVRPGPVLLVDDVVDSRWTLTVAGWLLRSSGAGPVVPFALAVATTSAS